MKTECRAIDPSKCRYHGNAAVCERAMDKASAAGDYEKYEVAKGFLTKMNKAEQVATAIEFLGKLETSANHKVSREVKASFQGFSREWEVDDVTYNSEDAEIKVTFGQRYLEGFTDRWFAIGDPNREGARERIHDRPRPSDEQARVIAEEINREFDDNLAEESLDAALQSPFEDGGAGYPDVSSMIEAEESVHTRLTETLQKFSGTNTLELGDLKDKLTITYDRSPSFLMDDSDVQSAWGDWAKDQYDDFDEDDSDEDVAEETDLTVETVRSIRANFA